MKLSNTKKSCFAIILAFALGSCATEPSLHKSGTGYYGYTWEKELQLGRESDVSIVKEMGLYPDDRLASYIREIGQSLLAESAIGNESAPEIYRGTEFTFRLLDSPVVNAFALPGGYIYVTRGLLAHLENEAQLAVVIGHEITHVEARHASKQALKQQLGQIGLLAGAVIGEQMAENKEFARGLVDLSGEVFQLVTLKYGRDAERESDLHGVEYAAKAGYAAEQGSAFFRSLDRISEKSAQAIPSWMSSHPDPGEREKTIRDLAKKWESELNGSPVVGRERFLEMIDGMIIGDNPRNGYVEANRFYHPDLGIQFDIPGGWSLQNESGAVYLIDPARSTLVTFAIASENSPLEAARDLQSKLSLEPTYAQETSINGLPAYVLEGNVSGESGILQVHSTFVKRDTRVFTFLGYGNASSFANIKRQVQAIPGSFQEIMNPQALSIQPYRISVAPAIRTASFRELLPSKLPPTTDQNDWAIMNQVELDERIEKGRLIKLPAGND